MGYYIRVLSPDPDPVSPSVLRAAVASTGLPVSLSGDAESSQWQQLVVAHPNGTAICAIERNAVTDSGLGREELDEFVDEIHDGLPKSAAAWLMSYLPS